LNSNVFSYLAVEVVLPERTRMKKKFEMQYSLNTSPGVLFSRLSTASGLSEWFADNVNVNGNLFTFFWDGSEQQAEMIQLKENKSIRFHWTDDSDPKSFFEFRIDHDDIIGDSYLSITDFSEDNEKIDVVDLWDSQISELKHVLGL
jgi:uncharacterized protein YndB with AHSA1/START domain